MENYILNRKHQDYAYGKVVQKYSTIWDMKIKQTQKEV